MQNHFLIRSFAVCLVLVMAGACAPNQSTGDDDDDNTPTPVPAEFAFYTPAWEDGAMVPTQYTCDGPGGWGHQNNPELIWENPPDGTMAFAMIFDDPTFGTPWPHWAFFTADASVLGIEEAVSNSNDMPAGVTELRGGDGRVGYIPNCPGGNLNTYRWRLWALDSATLGVNSDSTFNQLQTAAEAHVIEMKEFSGQSNAG